MSRRRRVAVSGCGAVTELYYSPALRRLAGAGRIELGALYDPSDEACARVARALGSVARAASFEELLATAPDLVIVASPPSLHVAQAKAALAAGAAVFCEKPVALSSADAAALTAGARAADRLLAVGMVRRRFPAARLVKDTLARRVLGAPLRFECFEGGPFRWPVRSASYFERAQSGGGVLVDIGSHLLDLLAWWLGPIELVGASDDAMGGVEANARLELDCGGVRGVGRLSRDWQRPNELVIVCERGSIRWSLDDVGAIELAHTDGRGERLAHGGEVGFDDCFTAQLDAVLDRLDGASAELVDAAELVPIVSVIECAYATRSAMPMPWLAIAGARAS